jgi:hypothetical protein
VWHTLVLEIDDHASKLIRCDPPDRHVPPGVHPRAHTAAQSLVVATALRRATGGLLLGGHRRWTGTGEWLLRGSRACSNRRARFTPALVGGHLVDVEVHRFAQLLTLLLNRRQATRALFPVLASTRH